MNPAPGASPGGPQDAAAPQDSGAGAPRGLRGALLRLAMVVAVIAGCAWLARHLDLRSVQRALLRARPGGLLLGAAFILVGMVVQALRLQALLRPVKAVPALRLTWYLLVSNAATNLLPARAGEALRVVMLKAREGIPAVTTIAAMLLERIIDALTLVVLLLPAPWLLTSLPPRVAQGLAFAVPALAGVVLLVLYAQRAARGRLLSRPFVAQLRDGALALQRPRLLSAALITALLAWVLEGLSISAVLGALDLRAPLYTPVIVLLAVNAAILLPSTPAQIGAFELGAVAGFKLAGVDGEAAVAAAVLCHAVQFFPVTLLGLLGLPGALRRAP